MKRLLSFILSLTIVMIVSQVQATVSTTDVNIENLPEATIFYVPVGDRSASIQNDLVIYENYNGGDDTTTVFCYVDNPYPEDDEGWYVSTDFNTNRTYDGDCYGGSEPNCGAYHPGEDWNLASGGDTDLGEHIYSIGAGKVVGLGYDTAFGNMVLIVHKLPDGELVMSVFAHMQNATSLNLGDSVTHQTQVGAIGKTGTGAGDYAHLHFEIRQESMLDIDDNDTPTNESDDTVTVSATYPTNYWPGTNTTFIANNYYDPTDFIQDNCLVGEFEDYSTYLTGLFLDEYNNVTDNGEDGIGLFGIPFDNTKGSWVHEWPDAACNPAETPPDTCNTDGLYVQDFLLVDGENEYWSQLVLNSEMGKV